MRRECGLLLCIMVLCVAGGALRAEDSDIGELRALLVEQQKTLAEQSAKMAAQDARMTDLQAKMREKAGASSDPVDKAKGVVGIRKNAVVTVGGQLNTRYVGTTGNVEHDAMDGAGMQKRSEYKIGNFSITDAKLSFKIDVNENFDAFVQLDLQHDSDRLTRTAGIAQKYWVRWKKAVCDTSFGVLIGRNDFIFSDRYNVGQYSGLLGKHDDFGSTFATKGITIYGDDVSTPTYTGPGGQLGEGMFSHRGNLTPNHVGWDYSRTTQINPYLELMDGKLRFDLSLMQAPERLAGGTSNTVDPATSNGVTEYRSINYGLGSGTFRIMWKPIEGLSLTGSVANFYQGNAHDGSTNRWDARKGISSWATGHSEWISKNATATNISIRYNPSFAKAWNFWGKWTHGWNDGWTKDLDSDAFNLGASYTFLKRWTVFAQGDYFTNKNKRSVVENWYEGNIWASYAGIKYAFPYGANLELGWRHEEYSYKNRAGYKHTKGKLDTIYGHVGYDF